MRVNPVSISVLLPVKNGATVIAEAIKSIIAQTTDDWELLITDDGSTDGTAAVVKRFSDPRIRLFHHSESRGVAVSLNEMIRNARGEFIARMDADDHSYPRRLEVQRRFLQQRSGIHLCGTAAETFGEQETLYRFPSNHEAIRAMLLFQPSLVHPSVMWKADVFRKKNLFYQEDPPTAEDYELWVRASECVRFANLRQPLLRYRIDPSIKDSPYVRQQREGDGRIKKEILGRLGLPADPESMDLHQALSLNRFSGRKVPSLERFEGWIGKLKQANRDTKIYSHNDLCRLLCEKYYWILSDRTDLGMLRIPRFLRLFPSPSRYGFSVVVRLFLKSLAGKKSLRGD